MDYYDYQSFVISNRDNLVKSTQGIHLLKAVFLSPLTVRTTSVSVAELIMVNLLVVIKSQCSAGIAV